MIFISGLYFGCGSSRTTSKNTRLSCVWNNKVCGLDYWKNVSMETSSVGNPLLMELGLQYVKSPIEANTACGVVNLV